MKAKTLEKGAAAVGFVFYLGMTVLGLCTACMGAKGAKDFINTKRS